MSICGTTMPSYTFDWPAQDVLALLAGISQVSGAAAQEKSDVDRELLRLQVRALRFA